MMAYEQLGKSSLSLINRVMLKAKTHRMILVEGCEDQKFVRNIIHTRKDILIQICPGKEHVIKFFSALHPNEESQDVFALVDIDYDWLLTTSPDYFNLNRVFTYTARDIESFKFFFQNTEIIAGQDRKREFDFAIQCALVLGRLRAWNTWKDLRKNFDASQKEIKLAFQAAYDSLDQEHFQALVLEHFELGSNFYSDQLLPHLESKGMNDSFLIRGKDLKIFFSLICAKAKFSYISDYRLSGRVMNSPLYTEFEKANLIEVVFDEE